MDRLFKRNFEIKINLLNNETCVIISEMTDSFHHIEFKFQIFMPHFKVESADINMIRVPLPQCKEAENFEQDLIGLVIEPGFRKKVISILGGSGGCSNLVDMALISLPLIVNANALNNYFSGKISKEEYFDTSKKFLNNHCLAFSKKQP